ncbi:MAG: hypothetical protein E7399_09685 [Ruminococcaceae bacterium]|nr:hypothetical protein [Oscillospiraceae bacterium]
MPLRLIGLTIMIGSAVYYSVTLVRRAKRRIQQTEELCNLILYIKNNIEAFMTPVQDIIASFSSRDEEISYFLGQAMQNGLFDSAANATLGISKEGMVLFNEFACRVGKNYKDEEIRMCEYYYNELSSLLKREKEETGQRMKMYKTLPVMSAISIALMLV